MGRAGMAAGEVSRQSDEVLRHRYDQRTIGCLCLYTTNQVMLEELMTAPIGEGDIFATANTIILMGRTREDGRFGPSAGDPQAPRQSLQ